MPEDAFNSIKSQLSGGHPVIKHIGEFLIASRQQYFVIIFTLLLLLLLLYHTHLNDTPFDRLFRASRTQTRKRGSQLTITEEDGEMRIQS